MCYFSNTILLFSFIGSLIHATFFFYFWEKFVNFLMPRNIRSVWIRFSSSSVVKVKVFDANSVKWMMINDFEKVYSILLLFSTIRLVVCLMKCREYENLCKSFSTWMSWWLMGLFLAVSVVGICNRSIIFLYILWNEWLDFFHHFSDINQ